MKRLKCRIKVCGCSVIEMKTSQVQVLEYCLSTSGDPGCYGYLYAEYTPVRR